MVDLQEKSDKQLKREAKKAEKQAKKAQHKSSNEDQNADSQQGGGLEESGEDVSQGKYGIAQMNQSREKPEFRFIEDFSILTEKLDNQTVWIRARLHTSRAKGTQKNK